MPQHTVVQTNQNNGPLPPQNTLTNISQRSSPHPQQVQQVKKVVVQPNNASDMDDLEDSITAAILTKRSVSESLSPAPQYPAGRGHFAGAHFPPYEPPQTLSQLLMDDADDERQLLTLTNGQRITLADYRRMQQPQRAAPVQQQVR